MHENSGIIITLEEEDFLVSKGDGDIDLFVAPVSDIGGSALSVISTKDIDTGEVSYSAVIPEHPESQSGTWEKAYKVAGLVMAQMEKMEEYGIFD